MSKEFILIILFVATVIVLEFVRKRNLLKHLLVAAFFGCIWMIISHAEYNYNSAVTTIFGVNLFSLFAWIMGLFAGYLLFRVLRRALKVNKWWKQFLLFTAMYIPVLLVAETLGYHFFGIVNIATVAYPGLAICDCLHAPAWMVASYILMGPAYFATCLLVGLESGDGVPPIVSGFGGIRNRVTKFIYRV
ncbi:MAG: hypothetical protein L0H38_03250 [bacterium]|nr:hypothetical protein [bacterium]